MAPTLSADPKPTCGPVSFEVLGYAVACQFDRLTTASTSPTILGRPGGTGLPVAQAEWCSLRRTRHVQPLGGPVSSSAPTDSPVMTVLEAQVAPERRQELTDMYKGSAARLPRQMLHTYLLQSATDPDCRRGISVWRSQTALDEYRCSVATPGGVVMFRAVGAEPKLTIWNVAAALEAPPRAAV